MVFVVSDLIYVSAGYPFKIDPPRVMGEPKASYTTYKERNPVGQYRRTFILPAGWKADGQTFLRFEGVMSAFYVWINGERIGYSQGSMEPSEFNITRWLKPGENQIALEVYRYSDGSYLEDQDFWRFGGIHRSIHLVHTPDIRIRDYVVRTLPAVQGNYQDFRLLIDPQFSVYQGMDGKGYTLQAVLKDADGREIVNMVGNLSYLQTDWYIDQMKRPAYESAPLPISADESKYAYDVRSYNYVINRLADSITVSDGLDYLYSDEDWTKDVPGYGKLNHLPTNKLYIPVNADAAVASGTVAPELKDSIVSRIVPDFTNKRGFTMSEIASLDIINTNAMQGWKRPVYFAVTVGSSYYLGLEDYFSRTGLAYQVVPLKGVSNNIDTDKMYDNMVNKFRWGGIDKATPEHPLYLDENVRRMCNTHRMMFGDLVVQLIAEGKTDKALTALDLIMEKIPGWQVTHDLTSISLAQSYLDLGEKTKGEALLTEILDNSAGYLNWYKDLTSGQLRSVGSDYQKHLYIIQAIHEMSTSYELPELQKRIEEKFAIRE